jgi:hypothetical protein
MVKNEWLSLTSPNKLLVIGNQTCKLYAVSDFYVYNDRGPFHERNIFRHKSVKVQAINNSPYLCQFIGERKALFLRRDLMWETFTRVLKAFIIQVCWYARKIP